MAASWTQIPGTPRSVLSVQATTEAAPAAAGDGLYLDEVAGFCLHILADSGQTLNGAGGTFDGYRFDTITGAWVRASELDITITAADIGTRGMSVVFQVAAPRGRLAHIANGVSVSSGGLNLYYLTSYLSGKGG